MIAKNFPFNGHLAWTNSHNYLGWKAVLNQEPGSDGISEYYSLERAKSLKGLPSTFLCAGSIELFANETLDFAKRLMYDGVLTELHLCPGYHHLGITINEAFHTKKTIQFSIDAMLRVLNV